MGFDCCFRSNWRSNLICRIPDKRSLRPPSLRDYCLCPHSARLGPRRRAARLRPAGRLYALHKNVDVSRPYNQIAQNGPVCTAVQSMLTRTIEWSWLKWLGHEDCPPSGRIRQLRPRSQSCWGAEPRTGRRWAAEDCSGAPAILLHLSPRPEARGLLDIDVPCHPPALARAGLPHGRERIDGILPARFWLT